MLSTRTTPLAGTGALGVPSSALSVSWVSCPFFFGERRMQPARLAAPLPLSARDIQALLDKFEEINKETATDASFTH